MSMIPVKMDGALDIVFPNFYLKNHILFKFGDDTRTFYHKGFYLYVSSLSPNSLTVKSIKSNISLFYQKARIMAAIILHRSIPIRYA